MFVPSLLTNGFTQGILLCILVQCLNTVDLLPMATNLVARVLREGWGRGRRSLGFRTSIPHKPSVQQILLLLNLEFFRHFFSDFLPGFRLANTWACKLLCFIQMSNRPCFHLYLYSLIQGYLYCSVFSGLLWYRPAYFQTFPTSNFSLNQFS